MSWLKKLEAAFDREPERAIILVVFIIFGVVLLITLAVGEA